MPISHRGAAQQARAHTEYHVKHKSSQHTYTPASFYGFVHPFNLFPEHWSHLLCHLLADAGAHECSPQALILTINAVTGFRPLKRPCRNSSLRQERHIDRFCLGKTDVHQRRRHVCTCVTSINLSTPARANPLATSGLLRVA